MCELTHNQVDYLNLQENIRNNTVVAAEQQRANQAREAETHRNNLVLELQGSDRNAETKRNNIVVAKENKRHNKATENIQKTVPLVSSQINASASKYAADTSKAASMYSSQVKAATEYANQANQRAIAAANNRTAEKIQKSKNATSKLLKEMDKLMNDKTISQRDRQSIRDMYTKIKINNDNIDANATQKDLDRQAKLLTSTAGLISTITTNQGANMAKTDLSKFTTKSGLSATVRGAINSAESKKSGAKPASYKSESDKSSTTRNLVINTKKKKGKSNKSKGKPKLSSASHVAIKKKNTGKSSSSWLSNPLGKFK